MKTMTWHPTAVRSLEQWVTSMTAGTKELHGEESPDYQQALAQTRAMAERIEGEVEARARAAGVAIVQPADVRAVLDTLT